MNHSQMTLTSLNTLKENLISAHGQVGKVWVDRLSETIKLLEVYWSLTDIQPVTNMSWNYVAFAKQAGRPIVLKIGIDKDAIQYEYQALQHFSGMGAINTVDFHPKYHALLLQRAVPGTVLKAAHLKKVSDVIPIYANVVKNMRLSNTPKHTFPHVKGWCDVIENINDPRVPTHYINKAKYLRTWIFETIAETYVCHGDLHVENIIEHENQWLAIDPKGVIGETAFEASAFDLLNENEQNTIHAQDLLKERMQQLARALNLNEERLIAWTFLRALFSIQWFIEDHGDPTKMLKIADHLYPLIINLPSPEKA